MVHEQAVDAVIDLKRNAAHGQDSLFGASTEAAETLTVEVPEQEWDTGTLLAFEREMLGLYVSSHPLDGAEPVLEAHRDTTIADLLASPRADAPVRVAGIISTVQRKVTKQGTPWAIITVEDHDAAVECLVFPKTYTLYGQTLAEDRVISVRGRTNIRDETLSVYGEDITTLDLSQTATEPPVVLHVHEDRLTLQLVRDLRQILTAHPGRTPSTCTCTATAPRASSSTSAPTR